MTKLCQVCPYTHGRWCCNPCICNTWWLLWLEVVIEAGVQKVKAAIPGAGVVPGHSGQSIHSTRCNGLALAGSPRFWGCSPVQECNEAWKTSSSLECLLHGLHWHAHTATLALGKALKSLQCSHLQAFLLSLVNSTCMSLKIVPLLLLLEEY